MGQAALSIQVACSSQGPTMPAAARAVTA